MNNIVKLNDGSEEIVSDEELEAAAELYDRIVEPTSPTPGPWGVEPEQSTHGETLVIVSRGEILARSLPAPHFSHPAQTGDLLNLTLMAAAPELLAVVQMYLESSPGPQYKKWHTPQAIRAAAFAALAKAGVKS